MVRKAELGEPLPFLGSTPPELVWEAVVDPGAWPKCPEPLDSPFSSFSACSARDGLFGTRLGPTDTQGHFQVLTQRFPVQPLSSPLRGVQFHLDLVQIILPSSLLHHLKLVSSR